VPVYKAILQVKCHTRLLSLSQNINMFCVSRANKEMK